ncbi:MAG: iron chelate uptake ABC transporter family permease subunit [Tissierellia bacterium]|nr:iron chelate uptake ABC transporter family permease subunit [Tissierellia bacterium]
MLKKNKMTVILFITLVILSIASLFVGVIDISINDILAGDLHKLEILFISRLPRLLAILCTGIGMSVAGLIMQQLVRNKFVSPTTGATISSAQFGILMALLFLPSSTLIGRAAFSFLFAILGTWVFVWFTQRIKFKDIIMVPLIGIMFNTVIRGITSFFAFKYGMNQSISTWMTGSFSLVIKGRYEIVYLVLPLVIIAFIFANYFNIVGMGKDFSKNLGVPYELVLFVGLIITAMITASIIVIVGSISYIGLIVPNIVTMFKGDKLRGTLIDTALFGGIFVLISDVIGRIVIAPYELPIELVIGVIGSILFIVLIFYRLNNGNQIIKFKRKQESNSFVK